MAENEQQLTPKEALAIKEASYRQGLYQAWFATALEQTKSVFTLSSAGVGLSATLIFSEHTKHIRTWAPLWLLVSVVCFSVAAGMCILVFRINGTLVSKLIQDKDTQIEDGLVGRLDLFGRIAFATGIVMLIFAAIAQIWM